MQTLPNSVDDLIDQLDAVFPLQNFPVTADIATVQRACGARDVIDFLRVMQKERDETTEERVFNPKPR